MHRIGSENALEQMKQEKYIIYLEVCSIIQRFTVTGLQKCHCILQSCMVISLARIYTDRFVGQHSSTMGVSTYNMEGWNEPISLG
jgi:hypothetical protein